MKITSLEFFRLDLALDEPYTIAYETVSKSSNVILQVHTDHGITGWGCAVPDKVVTGETPEEVLQHLDAVVYDLLVGQSPFQLAHFNHLLKQTIPQAASTIAMVDIALHDLLARKADLPLYQLLGGYRRSMPTSITIGILPLPETLELARYHVKKGFRILKIKGGLNLEEDVEKMIRIREILGKEVELRFDANQGYSPAQAIDFVQRTLSTNIEILEQPTSQQESHLLGEVTNNVEIPVMADESLKTLQDAFHLSSNELIDMVNIKIMKVGGLLESLHINSVAKAAGMEVMVGCLDECGLGIAAGLHFALSRPNIAYADLDGHLELTDDPFGQLFTLENGVLRPGDAPGLGKLPLL